MTAPLLRVVSFGYLHLAGEPAPQAEITLDARRCLYDPHVDPAMKQLTGLDPAVRSRVLDTPGAWEWAADTAMAAEKLRERTNGPVTVAVGCAGGRHRSVALAERIAQFLRDWKWEVDLVHLHIDRPVVERPKETP